MLLKAIETVQAGGTPHGGLRGKTLMRPALESALVDGSAWSARCC
jgi:hypothetical protein